MTLRTRLAFWLAGPDFWSFQISQSRKLKQLRAEMKVNELDASRLALSYCDHFLAVLEDPDSWEDQVEKLRAALVDLRDQVARDSEHVL